MIIYKDCVLGQCTVERGNEKGYNTWEFISLSNKSNENILGLHTNRRININSYISEAKVTKVIIFIKQNYWHKLNVNHGQFFGNPAFLYHILGGDSFRKYLNMVSKNNWYKEII